MGLDRTFRRIGPIKKQQTRFIRGRGTFGLEESHALFKQIYSEYRGDSFRLTRH